MKNFRYINKISFFRILNLYFSKTLARMLLVKVRIFRYQDMIYF